MYLTSRPDLGDVSQGKLVTLTNYYELFNGIISPRELEGLRLLVTPFPQQQLNATDDRKSAMPSIGSACFDCHANAHQNGATHLDPSKTVDRKTCSGPSRDLSAWLCLGPISGSQQGQRPQRPHRDGGKPSRENRPHTWLHPNASQYVRFSLAPRAAVHTWPMASDGR